MNNTHLDQAREWARDNIAGGYFHGGDRALAAAEVIQSLPDQWIDTEELRNWIDGMMVSDEPGGARKLLDHIKRDFLTPPLQTLADLVEQGNDPQSYQWTQAQVFPTAATFGIITSVDEYARSAIILFADGMAKNVPWAFITPLPGPKLEWPGGGVEDSPVADSEPALPCPEDVPDPQPGEAWLVNAREGEQREALKAGNRWYVKDGDDVEEWVEEALTPVARLVPEVKP